MLDAQIGRFFFHVLGSRAESEQGLTIEQTHAGLEVARNLGVPRRPYGWIFASSNR